MSATIITGYTGTRHITPAMDAAVFRSIFGSDSCIVNEGNHLDAEMPSINEIVIKDGMVSMQGHMIQVRQESLAVDTCATGYERIDLACMRFEHDPDSLVDSATLVVIKGTEVQTGNTPVPPSYNEGVIDEGATIVDFPLYEIDMVGSNVDFKLVAEAVYGTVRGTLAFVNKSS